MTQALPTAALAQHIGILGKTGSGKTSTGKLAIEQVVAGGARVCVLDPIKSDWWGVISSADGKRPGLPFHVLGGPRGHVPLHSGAGHAIAELVATGRLPLSVLDMAEFEPGGQQRFFVAFAETLIKRMQGVLYLVLEEAHEFAPKERAGFEKENLSIHFAKKLATAGRSKGIRLVLLTQRTQSLHNAMLGSCETMIVHRLTAPADQEPVIKWLKANVQDKTVRAEITDTMSSLKTGTGWLCSGEAKIFERRQFPRIQTFDNSATPTDDAGVVDVVGARVDFGALRALIGDAVQEAEANDPKKLKARIAELERAALAAIAGHPAGCNCAIKSREIKHHEPACPYRLAVESALERVNLENAALERHRDELAGQNTTLRRWIATVEERLDCLRPHVGDITQALGKISDVIRGPFDVLPDAPAFHAISKPSAPARPVSSAAVTTARAAPPASRITAAAKLDLSQGERIVLTAIAQHPEGVDATQIMVLTGYKRSTRDKYLQGLRYYGLVTDGYPVKITADGWNELGDYEPLPTGRALAQYWLQRLSGGELEILKYLIDSYPDPRPRVDIDGATNYKRSSRDKYLQKLQARKLVKPVGAGEVIASEALFG